MKEFMVLIGQIFLISCIQTIAEVFINPSEKPYQAKVLSMACFVGSLYLLLNYIFSFMLSELVTVMKFPF